MLIVKFAYFKVLLPMPRSITRGRAGTVCDRCSARDHHDLPNIDYPFHEAAARVPDPELRSLIEKHVARWKRGALMWCYIFERSGAKIVNNNRLPDIAS